MLRNIIYSSVVSFVFIVSTFSSEALAADSSVTVEENLFGGSLAIEEESLGQMRGTALSPELLGIAVFDAISENNVTNGTISGGNVINSGAFSNSAGLSTIIQNSGNNVLIQSATILNLKVQ